jgi:transcriptional regulator with XRE-family HTH domain
MSMPNSKKIADRRKRENAMRALVGSDVFEANRDAFDNADAVREAARFVREMRLHAKLSQAALGEKLGVSQARISEIERSETPEGISYALLKRVAAVCGFPEWPGAPSAVAARADLPIPVVALSNPTVAISLDRFNESLKLGDEIASSISGMMSNLAVQFMISVAGTSQTAAPSQHLGEIRMTADPSPPTGWAFCHGQTIAIEENTALYSLLGTTYGGDGQTSFALPDFSSLTAGLVLEEPGTQTGRLGLDIAKIALGFSAAKSRSPR